MSKFRVLVQQDSETKSFELDRKTATLSDLKQHVSAKFPKANLTNLRFVSSRGDYIELSNDSSLTRAVNEALAGNALYLDVRVGGASTGYSTSTPSTPSKQETASSSPSTPQSAAATPASAPSSANRTFTRPASSSVSNTPSSQPSTPSSAASGSKPSTPTSKGGLPYHVITWNVPADANSSLDKVKVNHVSAWDSFTFTIQKSKYATEVRVVLAEKKKLSFECTYSFEDTTYGGQRGTRTVTVTNSVGLPYEVTPDRIEATHENVVVKAPHDTL